MTLNIDDVLEVLQIVRETKDTELHIDTGEMKLSITRGKVSGTGSVTQIACVSSLITIIGTLICIIRTGITASHAQASLTFVSQSTIEPVITSGTINYRLRHTLISTLITHPVITLVCCR